MMSLASILIASVGRWEELEHAIESGLQQNCPSIEMIVYINGGDQAAVDKFTKRYPSVQFHQTREKIGVLKARNFLARQAQGQFLVFLDDDAYFLNRRSIREAVDYLNQHQEVGVVAFQILSKDGVEWGSGESRFVMPYHGAASIIRKSTWQSIGGYPDYLFGYGVEESDFSLSVLKRGGKIFFNPAWQAFHTRSPIQREHYFASLFANRLAFFITRSPAWLAFPALIRGMIMNIPQAIQEHAVDDYFKGFGYFLSRFFQLWKLRRPVSLKLIRTFRPLRMR